MVKEVRMSEHGDGEDAVGDEDSVPEWESGLPSGDDLTPLSQSLVPSILALAFNIVPERSRTIHDVNRASQNTLSMLRSNGSSGVANASSSNTAVAAEEDVVDRLGSSSSGSDPKKQKKSDGGEAVDSMAEEGDSETEEGPSGKTLKRPRLVWTPQLHKRFVDVVDHLGVKKAVPKTIMQLMNVEGLTRENVASHLQKYRLYLKRIQGLKTESPSSSDQLYSSTSVPPQSFNVDGGSGHVRATGKLGIPIPVPSMMPMPVYGNNMGMQGYHHNNLGHDPYHHHHHHNGNGAFESHQYMMQQNKFGSMATSPSVGGGGVNDK